VNKVKVVQISTFSYKAAGNIMMNLHRAMMKNGIDSYVVWGRGRKAENDHEYFMDDSWGVKLHGVYTRITDKTGFASTLSTRKLLNWLDEIEPDIIHLHCIHGYFINISLLFTYIKEKNIKVIWTQHDCWAFTGHCAYFDACGCEKWKTGCHDCEQLTTYPASRLMDNSKWNWKTKKELFTGANVTVVTPCEWLSELVKISFLREYPIRVIYNGIDTNVFKPTKSYFKKKNEIEAKKMILGVASEWTERKGLRDFIELDEMLDKKEYVIVLVGVSKKQVENLPKDIIALNRTNNIKELVEIYSAADVYFNPTYEDNFPTTNLEATACGTPVITYDTGGSPESVDPRAVVQKGNLNRVKDIICSELQIFKPRLRDEMKVESMVAEYIQLYRDVYGE
jgi:putative colanic acid biosynthesis glycosyltransferase